MQSHMNVCVKYSQIGKNILTDEDRLIELCERLAVALDINYLRGTVSVGRKRFTNLTDAVAHAQSRADAVKNFGNQ